MWLHLCWREGSNHVPWPAGCGTPRCGQFVTAGAHCWLCWFVVHWVFSCETISSSLHFSLTESCPRCGILASSFLRVQYRCTLISQIQAAPFWLKFWSEPKVQLIIRCGLYMDKEWKVDVLVWGTGVCWERQELLFEMENVNPLPPN